VFIVDSARIAIALCVITMLGWGSWANTQKLAGKGKLPFQLYYWDYAIGIFFLGLAFAFTLGSFGSSGMAFIPNLNQAAPTAIGSAIASGALFNLSNILFVVAIDDAGLAVAFPVGVGLSAVIGTTVTYFLAPKGNPVLLFSGIGLLVTAMFLSGWAHSKLPQIEGKSGVRGIVFAVIAGALMGFFYPQLMHSISLNFNSVPIQAGKLTPYAALASFGLGLLLSNFILNTVFMRVAGLRCRDYFQTDPQLHLLGFAGGIIWMLALGLSVIAAGAAGPAISFALGQGATLVAATWGVAIWREFRDAPPSTVPLVLLMFLGYAVGLILIGMAIF
jgi:glucose uptake protein